MTISWMAWERMRDSLDYSWARMQELDPCGSAADREEYEALAEAALRLANRLVLVSGADVPALDTQAARQQWGAESRKAAVTRERIVEHSAAVRRELDIAEQGLADA